jgi:predicted AAA+ superfamily ATPase
VEALWRSAVLADAERAARLRGRRPAKLAPGEAESFEWRRSFLQTFLERDLPQLGIRIPAETLRRFWSMVAHYHAQTWNGAEIARAFGVGENSVRRYLDLLTDALVLRQLPPWHANVSKRQVRSPKVFVEDSGLLHALLGIESESDLAGHPKVGASWEGFLVKEIVERLNARTEECFFWATHSGAELDLLIVSGQRRLGFEVKRTSAPRLTRSMAAVREDLGLERLDVIHAGDRTFPLAQNVRAVAASQLLDEIEPLRRP